MIPWVSIAIEEHALLAAESHPYRLHTFRLTGHPISHAKIEGMIMCGVRKHSVFNERVKTIHRERIRHGRDHKMSGAVEDYGVLHDCVKTRVALSETRARRCDWRR